VTDNSTIFYTFTLSNFCKRKGRHASGGTRNKKTWAMLISLRTGLNQGGYRWGRGLIRERRIRGEDQPHSKGGSRTDGQIRTPKTVANFWH